MTFQKGNQWRFKPGQSGNPSGKPKGIISKRLRKRLKENRAIIERIVDAWIAQASVADKDGAQHLRMLLDRLEGPVGDREASVGGAMPAESIILSDTIAAKLLDREKETSNGNGGLPEDD